MSSKKISNLNTTTPVLTQEKHINELSEMKTDT